MMNNLLRKEPTIAPRNDIPVLTDRVNVSWEKLSTVLERVRPPEPQACSGFRPIGSTPRPAMTDEAIIAEVTRRIVPAVCEKIEAELDDAINMALSNTYQRLRSDLAGQLSALITEAVREHARDAVARREH